MFDWNDLRHFLAVARAGTTLGAARALGTSQPTVVRRISAFEKATGVELFDRGPSGYALTLAGRELLGLAERVESDVQALADGFAALQRSTPGVVRLTVGELINEFVFPAVHAFKRRHPDVEVQLLLADRALDLLRGEADVAIRSGDTPAGDELYARRLPDGGWTAYAGRAYRARAGLPSTPEALNGHTLVAGEGYVGRVQAMVWLLHTAPKAQIALRCNSFVNVHAAVRAGLGISMLPCAAGGTDPELVACFPPPEGLARPLWLLTRRELRRLPYIRALLDTLAEHMEAHRTVLTGRS